MSKVLLTEVILPERKPLIAEADRGDGFMYLKGLFLEGEAQNHNGRIYPLNEIQMAVKSINERIQSKGPIGGELDHPEGLNINFDRISHAITKMDVEGPNGVGTMRIMNAGLGLIVKGAIEIGIQPGVSSRGSGNIGPDGKVSEFDIITIDIVANPSAPNAYPEVSLTESILRNKHGQEALTLSRYVHDDASAQKYLQQEITKFLIDVRDQVTWRK